MMPLSFAPEGHLVRVVCIRAGRGLSRRLIEMGIAPGKVLRVVRTLGAGPVIIEVCGDKSKSVSDRCNLCCASCGNRIVIGFGTAMKILVEEVARRE